MARHPPRTPSLLAQPRDRNKPRKKRNRHKKSQKQAKKLDAFDVLERATSQSSKRPGHKLTPYPSSSSTPSLSIQLSPSLSASLRHVAPFWSQGTSHVDVTIAAPFIGFSVFFFGGFFLRSCASSNVPSGFGNL